MAASGDVGNDMVTIWVRDYEKNPDSSKAMVYIASIGILLKKLFATQAEVDNESICPSTAI